ncbi:hypothetical protein UA08_04448 [Talaromyces atroroseus]|uniref:Zn(2)-C6 fungal-type domain-containing protein n=1 Tax=Talaromyces atroroseus TaxID=1441469 RepID=A0A1Q5Q9H9_TALAT|nr:hypothetical protein UA08_04448 [Talaromyces atroroseus]OKL60774.1 hypothetical protein UA08_04448 [Talaromyces atroroseus]
MSQPPSKRFACDRCRDQKLRCPREENSSDPCARCLRAGAVCVTGCTRLIGRPPRAASTSNTNANSASPSAVIASTVSARRRRERESRSAQTNSRSALLSDRRGDRNTLPPGSTTIQKPFQHSDGLDDVFGLPLVEDDPSQPNWLKTTSSNGLVQGNLPQTTALEGVPSLFTLGAHAPSVAALQSSNTQDSLDMIHDQHTTAQFLSQDLEQQPDFADSQLPELPDGCDAVLWLANLNGSISSQLAQVHTRPCTGPSDSQTAIFGDLYGPSPDDPNPLGELLRCTSQFSNILRAMNSMLPPFSSPSSASLQSPSLQPLELLGDALTNGRPSSTMGGLQPHWTSSSSSSRTLPSNTPTILMIITTHLQLVRLYDAVVARMYASLLEMREGEVASFQALPGLQLGGFPLSHGNLHIKIILQVLEHQLDLIERVMGLPAEYRLSTQQESPEGIFRNSELLVLLRAVMGQNATSCHGMGLYYIVSLKENLQKVKQLLQG